MAVRAGGVARRALMLARPPKWTEGALCPQVDHDMFFPGKSGPTAQAQRICALCPVRVECLADALARNEQHGVWGGLSTRQRRQLRTAGRRAA